MSSDMDYEEYELRVREIALRDAVNRANGIEGPAVTLELAEQFEKFLRGVR